MNEKEEILISTQISFFFDEILKRPEDVWQNFNEHMSFIFNGSKNVLPVPDVADFNDMPVVSLNSEDGVYSCNIAKSRLDFYHYGVGRQSFLDVRDAFVAEINKVYNFLSDSQKQNKGIKRIGFVTNIFIEDTDRNQNLKKLLSDNFLDIFSNEVSFETGIKHVSRTNIIDIDINNFTTIGKFNAIIAGQPGEVEGVLITRDFNSIPETNIIDNIKDNNFLGNFVTRCSNKFKIEEFKNTLWQGR